MSYLQISQKVNKLFDDIPEFNSGNITYDCITLSNANFGSTTTQETLSSSSYDFITSFSLSITLPALTDTDHIASPGGYISWVNNIGHSIIDGIEIKINSETIVDLGLPYDKWLDIYQENNDVDDNESDALGKYESNISRDKYDNQQVNLEVPLHLWMTDYTRNAFPFFLINDGKIYFRLKLKKLASVIYYNPDSNAGNINDTIQPTIKLNIGSYQINDLTLKTNLRTQTFKTYFNYYTFNRNTLSRSNNILSTNNSPLKQIEIVIVENNRNTRVSDLNSVIEINKEDSDINKNDYLNYSATSDSVIPGLLHSIDGINITINGNTYFRSNIKAEFIRKLYSIENVLSVPNKYVYNIAFTPRPHTGRTFGCLDMEYIDNMNLTCQNITSSASTIFTFFTHIRKMIIKSGYIEYDNWTATDIEFRTTGFKFGDSNVVEGTVSVEKPLEDLTVEEITEIKQEEEVFKVATTTNIYNTFLVFNIMKINNTIILDVIIGDNITPNVIEGIKNNLDKGSLNKYGILNYLFEIVGIEQKKYSEPVKINDYLKSNILKYMNEQIDNNPNISINDLFDVILPFSRGFYINIDSNIRRLDYWLNDLTIKKSKEEIVFYVNSLMLNNDVFNNRIYTITLNKTIDIRSKPYRENYTYWDTFQLDKTNLFYLEYNNIVPRTPGIYIIASELHPKINEKLTEDLNEMEIEQQLGIYIDCVISQKIKFLDLKSIILSSYEERLNNLYNLAESNKTNNYDKYYQRLKNVYNISEGTIDRRFTNIFSVLSTYSVNLLINGVGKVTILTLDEYLKNKTLNFIEIKPELHQIEFNFLNKTI